MSFFMWLFFKNQSIIQMMPSDGLNSNLDWFFEKESLHISLLSGSLVIKWYYDSHRNLISDLTLLLLRSFQFLRLASCDRQTNRSDPISQVTTTYGCVVLTKWGEIISQHAFVFPYSCLFTRYFFNFLPFS